MVRVSKSQLKNTQKERNDKIILYSGKTSEIVRQLSFAGIGIIWLFKDNDENNNIILSASLSISMICIFISILCEFFHYYTSTEKNNYYYYKPDQEIPKWSKQMSWWLWRIKALLVFVAYVLIGFHISQKFHWS